MKRNVFDRAMILLVLVSMLSLSVLAATTLFVKKSNGFNCIGSGFISGRSLVLSFSATPLPSVPVQPDETYHSSIFARVENKNGFLLGVYVTDGNLHNQLSEITTDVVGTINGSFEFQGSHLGWYTLK